MYDTDTTICIHCEQAIDLDNDAFVVGREDECAECIARLFPTEWARLRSED